MLKQIPVPAINRASGSCGQSAAAATVPAPSSSPAARPALFDKEADSDIPARCWSSWTLETGTRALARPLTNTERAAVQRRAYALECGLLAMLPDQRDIARAALHAMLGGFRSLRARGDEADASVEVLLVVLREFPSWAIEEGCLRIIQRRTELDPPLDPKWPPNDAQIYAVVFKVMEPFRKALASAQSLLAAPVEPPTPKRPPQTEIDIAVARGRQDVSTLLAAGDGKHAERVMADIAVRKAARA